MCSQPTDTERWLADEGARAMDARRNSTPEKMGDSYGGLVGQLVVARFISGPEGEAHVTAKNDVHMIVMGDIRENLLWLDCWQNGWPISIKVCLDHSNADPYLASSTLHSHLLYVFGRRSSGIARFYPVGWAMGTDMRELAADELKLLGMQTGYGLRQSELRPLYTLWDKLMTAGPGKL